MEITNANAGVLLPYIAAQLRGCLFFALDLEYTGIDQDGAEAGADTPAALADSLMRKPGDLYPKKLEAIKPYSIVQIGFSLFTSCPVGPPKRAAVPAAAGAANDEEFRPTVEKLAVDVRDFVSDVTAKNYYTDFLERVVQKYNTAAGERNSAADTSAWLAIIVMVSKEAVSIGEQLRSAAAACAEPLVSSVDPPYVTNSTVELLRRYHFLEALRGTVDRCSREAEQLSRVAKSASPSASSDTLRSPPGTPAPVMDSYCVQTFTAYMFPATIGEIQNVSLNLDTAEFLVKNNVDLTHWVKEGLRFKPLEDAAAALAASASNHLKNVRQQLEPHKELPHFTECFNTKLDSLLPLSLGELRFVMFVLRLYEAPFPYATSNVRPFYVGASHSLIKFARGEALESSLPDTIYVGSKIYNEEVTALAAIGITKVNRKFVRISDLNSGSAKLSASSDQGAHPLSMAAQGYGTALFETLLYATEVLRKPMVLYNGYTDLLFLLLSLYGPSQMPPTLDAFKWMVHRHFPVLYDARVLACAGALQELGSFTGKLPSAVEEMTKVASVARYVTFRFDRLLVGGDDPGLFSAAHNAGFDAMLTGKLFAYATYAIKQAGVSYDVYANFLATYSTLLSINLTEKEDGVLQEEPTPVFFLADTCGLRSDSIHEVLARAGLTALVVFRGNCYTIQPVGKACSMRNYQTLAETELTRKAHGSISLLRIDI